MKLLLDQNLSWRLVRGLQDLFPGSAHVRDFALDRASDEDIWQFARDQGFVVLSKDADFEQRSFLRGHPPKCIWLRVGNSSTDRILQTVCANTDRMIGFGVSEVESYMILP